MEYLRQSIDIIWNRLSTERWLEEFSNQQNSYSSEEMICSETKLISDDFVRCLVDVYKELTMDQANSIAEVVKSVWMQPYHQSESQQTNLNPRVAHILVHFMADLIEIDNSGEPRCKFDQLLKWREVSLKVGDDMLVCAMLAHHDVQNNQKRKDFSWSPVLKHTNHILNSICDKGLSELHFHLKGSSLNFDIQWLSLMNDIEKREKSCIDLQKHCKSDVSFLNILHNRSLYDLLIIAAYLRWWLFQCCVQNRGNKNPLMNIQVFCEILQNPCFKKNEISTNIVVDRTCGRRYACSPNDDGAVIDYAIPVDLPQDEISSLRYVNSVLHGERLILYSAFKKIYGGDGQGIEYDYINFALLIYTKIKCLFRRELLQINNRKGFENFQQYQDDKSVFTKDGSVYKHLVNELAIKATCCNQLIKYIECRIGPSKNEKKMLSVLNQFQNLFTKGQKGEYITNKKITKCLQNMPAYVIIHFIKKEEKNYNTENVWRNFVLRNDVKIQATMIKSLYARNRMVRRLICGFDAANAERDARPEVFAQAYRYLRNELHYPQGLLLNEQPHSMGMTYHVGEDFWDVIDGLRAIDEAVFFLGLCGGDRIGHAMALGINVAEYYGTRHQYVTMPKQVFLDNLVWLQRKLNSYNIPIPSELDTYITEQVDMYAHEIYEDDENSKCSIRQLYYAWMLRGDDPNTLGNYQYLSEGEWGRHAYNHSSNALIERELQYARQNDSVVRFASSYHRNAKRGDGMCVEKLPISIIGVLEELQYKMRQDIEQRKIAIETNLSSNLKIGEFHRFDEHPILKFNRDGLDDKCDTSILVSINTDDQGIFATSITNEYALMASAIEKIKDENGESVYRPSQVINWLDSIRESTIAQRFVKEDSYKN